MNILKGFSNASVVNPALFENNGEKTYGMLLSHRKVMLIKK